MLLAILRARRATLGLLRMRAEIAELHQTTARHLRSLDPPGARRLRGWPRATSRREHSHLLGRASNQQQHFLSSNTLSRPISAARPGHFGHIGRRELSTIVAHSRSVSCNRWTPSAVTAHTITIRCRSCWPAAKARTCSTHAPLCRCTSAYSAASHGHAHPRILAALTEQARRLAVPSRATTPFRLGPFLAEGSPSYRA